MTLQVGDEALRGHALERVLLEVVGEEGIEALPAEAYTIKVGIDRTSARFNLTSVEEVRKFLNELIES